MRRFGLIFIASMLSLSSFSQATLAEWEDYLYAKIDTVRSITSVPKMEAENKEFSQLLTQMILMEGAFEFPFEKLSKKMSTITSPDKTFRIFNWNIENSYRENQFYCVVLIFDKKNKSYKTLELKDNHRKIFDAENKSLDHRNWYGALYYQIIPMSKGFKEYYTLLGWNGKARNTNEKIIEVLQFDGTDRIKFGAPIFKYPDGTKKRVIIEFAEDAIVSVKYHEKKDDKRIVYDHVMPLSADVEGIKDFYYPDLSYDALVLTNGKWILEENVDMRLDKKVKGFTNPLDLEEKF